MSAADVERLTEAVLYEGYNLYPYRPSAVKNRQRWTFGGIYPRAYCERQVGERWSAGTACLVLGRAQSTLYARVRFLHLLSRDIAEVQPPQCQLPHEDDPAFRLVDCLQSGSQTLRPWQEATEREVNGDGFALGDRAFRPLSLPFCFPAWREAEAVRDAAGLVVGAVVRRQRLVEGELQLSAERVASAPSSTPLFRSLPGDASHAAPVAEEAAPDVFRVQVRLANRSAMGNDVADRDEALLRSLASAHIVLHIQNGSFVSQQDPPGDLAALAAECGNDGLWPVLVGDATTRDTLLAAPIILYDFPQIAPESPGDLFDATEIDEILTLRIMTMTDAEKREARAVDARTRALLDRTDSLAEASLASLHGAWRGLRQSEAGQ